MASNEKVQLTREELGLLLSFVPDWAKEVPEGLCATMYGTLTADGDRQIKQRVDSIRSRIVVTGI